MSSGPPLSPELEALATEWIRDAEDPDSHDKAHESWFTSGTLAESNPEAAWALTLALIDRLPDERLDLVAAVVLEHILEHHAEAFVSLVELQAARDPRFRECLATVWLVDDYASPAVLARLNAASGNRLDIATRAELDQMEQEWDRTHGGA